MTSDAATGQSPKSPRSGRFWWSWIILACLGVASLAQLLDLVGDHAFNNLLSVVLVMLAGTIGLVRLLIRPNWTWRTRLGLIVGVAALPAIFAILFRVEGFTGEMYPKFALRFRTSSEVLAPAAVSRNLMSEAVAEAESAVSTPYDFPRFLGPHLNQVVDNVSLRQDWTAAPPHLVWKNSIGAGWSGFAVVGNHVVTLEQHGESEEVTCYDLPTGKLRWSQGTPTRYDLLIAGTGPRSTPTIEGGRIYVLGATGRLSCLNLATGRVHWQHDLRAMYDISDAEEHAVIQFGRANSPLVLGELVIIPVGGPPDRKRAGLVAFDKLSGNKVWEGGERNASYSSPIPTTIAGREQILIVNEDFVSSHDPATGKTLWEYEWLGKTSGDANVSQAVPVDDDRVFLSKGYVRGAALLKIEAGLEGTLTVRELWKNAQVLKTKFTNVVIHQGFVYGLSDGILECAELETGKRQWKDGRYGHGQILLVGDLLLVLSESGELVLIEPTPRVKNRVLSRMQVLEGKTWNPLALAGKYLLVRNAEQAACYEVPLETPTDQ